MIEALLGGKGRGDGTTAIRLGGQDERTSSASLSVETLSVLPSVLESVVELSVLDSTTPPALEVLI